MEALLVLVAQRRDCVQHGFPNNGGGRKQTQSLEIGEMSWGFFRLLSRGQTSEPRLVTWTLPGDGGRSPRAVKFEFVEDPWALLKVRR